MNQQSDAFHLVFQELNKQRQDEEKNWLPFFVKESLHCGIYHLAAGQTDQQQPHDDDEVYYVVSGKAHFEVEGNTTEVGAGSLLFVAAKDSHRFMDIVEDLTILVFFARHSE